MIDTKVVLLNKNRLDKSSHKPKKIWVNKGSKFSKRSRQDVAIYSIHNEEKSFVADISIRTLKNEIY